MNARQYETATEFRCANCKRLFTKAWSDEEAKEEQLKRFGEIPEEERCVVCDECFRLVLGVVHN